MTYDVGQKFDRKQEHYLLPPGFMTLCPACRVSTWHHVFAVDDAGVQKEITVCNVCSQITRVSRV